RKPPRTNPIRGETRTLNNRHEKSRLVRSAFGEVTVGASIDPYLREGVVSMEHGWGLQDGLRLSRERPGVNVNELMPHGPGTYEPLSNQAQLTGVPVEVIRLEG
ncbi:molybdopterin dinucleotide binding domain-containing protein, partial [Gordonia sp. DT30]|uniref:molybdopterin dinucleotide binding domain-containing protein n=1 Tax=Gordonia sp. DT30 TaxID=3416546 RepID=UPI003CF9545C